MQQVNLPEVFGNGPIKKQIRKQKRSSFYVFGGKVKDLYVKLTFSFLITASKIGNTERIFNPFNCCYQQVENHYLFEIYSKFGFCNLICYTYCNNY